MLGQHLASISFVSRISDLFREMLVLNRGRHKEKFLESRYGFKYRPLLPGIGQLKNAFIRLTAHSISINHLEISYQKGMKAKYESKSN